MYEYRCNLGRVIDGDTVELLFDLGFHVWCKAKCRLLGIDAPELPTVEGQRAKEHLQRLIEYAGVHLRARTSKTRAGTDRQGKYGRYLVELLDTRTDVWISINDEMVSDGQAKRIDT